MKRLIPDSRTKKNQMLVLQGVCVCVCVKGGLCVCVWVCPMITSPAATNQSHINKLQLYFVGRKRWPLFLLLAEIPAYLRCRHTIHGMLLNPLKTVPKHREALKG